MNKTEQPYDQLRTENELLRQQLAEANDTIEAIKNGEVDALVVQGKNGHEIFTLKSADHTYRVFIEKMKEGAVTLNGQGVIVYGNSSFFSLIGKKIQQVISEPFESFVVEADKKKYHTMIKQGWKYDVRGELSLIQHNHQVTVQLSITKLETDSGVALSIIITDLTVQKEILRQLKYKNEQLNVMNIALELSNHDLQQFASVASHDLQEPLRKIQVFSSLLNENYAHELTEKSKTYLEKITSSASRMKVLIIDILNYSRLSAKDNQVETTDFREMTDQLLEDLEMTIKEKNARIVIGALPVLKVNRGQMRQVIQNLISNAIKFSKVGVDPIIEISSKLIPAQDVEAQHPIVNIHIRDNGIGFDEKYSKSIFNLFEKLHSKDDYEGTGIGLAIAKKIIEKHHGKISVISHIGVGTEFIISLPAQ